MEIVTGRTGVAHITSVQDRALNQGIVGKDVYILNTGQNLKAEIASNNEIHIYDGALLFQGCEFAVTPSTYDTITVPNGSQGMQRKDLITIKYTYDGISQTEKGEWGYIQGKPNASNPAIPSVSSNGDLQKLDSIAEAAVFVVTLNGVNITSVTPVIDVIKPMASDTTPVLWEGSERMRENKTIVLSEPISAQKTGICLEWQLANSNTSAPYGDSKFQYIPKYFRGTTVFDSGTVAWGTNCRKRITISDTQIKGEINNRLAGTTGGITYDNAQLVLVKVTGW